MAGAINLRRNFLIICDNTFRLRRRSLERESFKLCKITTNRIHQAVIARQAKARENAFSSQLIPECIRVSNRAV